MFITLDDKSARLELMIFAEEAERYGRFIKEEQLVFMQVSVQPDRYAGGDNLRINCKRVMDLTHARVSNAHTLLIDLDLRTHELNVAGLKDCLKQNLDTEGLSVAVRTHIQGATAEIKLGMDWQVIPTDELVAQLRRMDAVRQVSWE
jgi:DNA polymerase-3 subunit alpha